MSLKYMLTAAVIGLGGIAVVPASAMPLENLAGIGSVEHVRMVCNWRGCWEVGGYDRRERYEGRREGRFDRRGGRRDRD